MSKWSSKGQHIYDSDGTPIADALMVDFSKPSLGDALKVATHIVQCVNGWDALKQSHDELVAALELTQFGFLHRRCPVCAGWNQSPAGETDYAHTEACPVALALAKAKEVTK